MIPNWCEESLVNLQYLYRIRKKIRRRRITEEREKNRRTEKKEEEMRRTKIEKNMILILFNAFQCHTDDQLIVLIVIESLTELLTA